MSGSSSRFRLLTGNQFSSARDDERKADSTLSSSTRTVWRNNSKLCLAITICLMLFTLFLMYSAIHSKRSNHQDDSIYSIAWLDSDPDSRLQEQQRQLQQTTESTRLSSTKAIARSRARLQHAIQSKSLNNMKFFWCQWPIEYGCDQYDRVGDVGDGGKYVCDLDRFIAMPSVVVYSIGSNNDVSFEVAIRDAIPNSDRHTFDMVPSPSATPGVTNFHLWAVSNVDGHVDSVGGRTISAQSYTLPTIMKMLGHERIHILKMDIESSEYSTLQHLFGDNSTIYMDPEQTQPRIEQLMVEFHLEENGNRGVGTSNAFIERAQQTFLMLQPHYYITGKEQTPGCFYCVEYTFLHKSLARQ